MLGHLLEHVLRVHPSAIEFAPQAVDPFLTLRGPGAVSKSADVDARAVGVEVFVRDYAHPAGRRIFCLRVECIVELDNESVGTDSGQIAARTTGGIAGFR